MFPSLVESKSFAKWVTALCPEAPRGRLNGVLYR